MNLDMPDKIFGFDSYLLKVFIVPFLIIVLMMVSGGMILMPKVEETRINFSESNKISKNRKTIEAKRNYLSTIDQESIMRDRDYLNMAMLQSKDAYVLVKVVRTVAQKYNFVVDTFRISPGELKSEIEEPKTSKGKKTLAQSGLVSIPVSLTMMGPEEQYMDVIRGLEKTLPILSLDNMDYKVVGGVMTINITISSYFTNEKIVSNINSLSLSDLTLNQTENDLVTNISQFNKIEGVTAGESGLLRGEEFVKYERENPFSL